jgi:ribonuclease BN (tRNA processing enzyme)
MPQPDRACSGYLLETDSSLNLFDCGSGVVGSFLRCGFDPQRLTRVFVSHTHSDHVSDLTLLIQMLHGLKSRAPLTVYIPDEFVTPFESLLRAVYLFPEKLSLPLKVVGCEAGVIVDEDITVRTVANTHQAVQMPLVERLGLPNRGQCFSYHIGAGGKSILYSADLGSLEDIRGHLAGLDLCVIETTHIDLDGLFIFAAESPETEFILTHLGDATEVLRLRERIHAAGLQNVRLAEDGMRVDL